jgi:Type I phosphodiesterase / nucleotide pyrophosphatase/Tetratricopeptide repeat
VTRLLLIGAAGLDWAGFDQGTRAGSLPHLAALRTRGVAGWLSGAADNAGPAPWVSIVTGYEPEYHGVWRAMEEWPGGVRPTTRASWGAAPLWARLETAGVSTAGVGWPVSRPGAAWAGIHVDPDFATPTGRTPAEWALPLHCAPSAAREGLRPRRVHPTQITAAMLRPLVPDLASIDQSRDANLPGLAVGLAQAASIQAAAVWLMGGASGDGASPAPDAVFVHHACLGSARAAFDGQETGVFVEVVPGAWRFLDGLIGRLAELAGPDALVLVVSPGWRNSPGVVLAAGPTVAPDPDFHGASLLSIAPTVLGRFGLQDAALPSPPLRFVRAEGKMASAPAPLLERPARPDARLVHALRKHGYRPPRRAPRTWRATGAAELARLVLTRNPALAADLSEQALRLDPNNVLALRSRVRALVATEQPDPLPALGDRLLQVAPDRGWGALAHGAHHVLRREIRLAQPWLTKAEADPEVETLLTVAAVWIAASRHGAAERVFRAIQDRDPDNVSAEIGLALCQGMRRDFLGAEAALNRALKRDPTRPAIHLQLAQILARSGRKAEAADVAQVALRLGASPEMAAAASAGRLGS